MITDLKDLEPRLGQYDPGLILIGPVLSLSMSDYRYFHIAANGNKVYEAIGLGFFENEADAESQRADIIEILKSRFREMLACGSHYEMACAVSARWPNEETNRALADAAPKAKIEADAAASDGGTDDDINAPVAPSDDEPRLVNDIAREPVVSSAPNPPDRLDVSAIPDHGHFELDQDDLASAILRAFHRTDQPPLNIPNPPHSTDDQSARSRLGHSGGRDEDLAAVAKALRPSHQPQSAPKLPAATPTSSTGDRVATKQERKFNQNDAVPVARGIKPPDRPQSLGRTAAVSVRSLAFIALLICAVAGTSALLTWVMLRSSSPHMAHEVGSTTASQQAEATAPASIANQPTASIKPDLVEAAPDQDSPSRPPSAEATAQRAAMPVSSPEQPANLNKPMRQGEPGPAAVAALSPAPQPPEGASTQLKTMPDPGPDRQAQVDKPTQHGEPAPAAAPQPPEGASTQAKTMPDPGLEQQAEANKPTQHGEPTPAAVPASPPAPQPPGGATTQAKAMWDSSPEPAKLNEPARLGSPAPAPLETSPQPQPQSGVASTRAKTMPDSHPEQQAKVDQPTRQLDPPQSATNTPAATVSSSPQQPTSGQESSVTSRLDPQEIATLIERSSAFLKRGDLASARLLLRRAAEAGSADAALTLGSTFDPVVIQQMGVIGIEPDIARARQWYEKAAELGSDAASQRLASLKNR